MQVPGVFETGGGAGASRGSIGDAALNGRLTGCGKSRSVAFRAQFVALCVFVTH